MAESCAVGGVAIFPDGAIISIDDIEEEFIIRYGESESVVVMRRV